MTFNLLKAASRDRTLLQHLLQLCLHDLSEFSRADIDAQGRFAYPFLDLYWTEPGRAPFWIKAGDKVAGFVLVRLLPEAQPETRREIAEFFVLRKYRNKGIGARAAQRVLALYPDKWRVCYSAQNVPAENFWRKVVQLHAGGAYHKRLDPENNRVILDF
jgi:predicted acetyltransferase